ncbi:oxygenase MpaB family protein [Sphingoaurantiacus capsulatus]|uniref:Oxygenase MpaB family protein n=1 Tax=Sphingoaurantiacus capsulatus TaxID=1771310 RepID=A0ABV7XAW6_9SPHN
MNAEPINWAAKRTSRGMPSIDFTSPAGAPALYAPDSISWRVFKNPISLFIGGVAAVLLELAEPRVRSGVWGHSIFPTDPLTRIRRTGLATHVTFYAPANVARQVIKGVVRMHDKVKGETPGGLPYFANDPVLLDWVQATASYGFIEAYSRFANTLSRAERDRAYAESEIGGQLFGATGAPRSVAECEAQVEAMRPLLEPHPIVDEFLSIMTTRIGLKGPLRPLQRLLVRAGVELLPEWVIERLELGPEWRLSGFEKRLVRTLGAIADRIPIPGTPPYQAAKRVGLPLRQLYGH